MNYAAKIIKFIDEIDNGERQFNGNFRMDLEFQGVNKGQIYQMSTHKRKYPYYANWLIEHFSGQIDVGGQIDPNKKRKTKNETI